MAKREVQEINAGSMADIAFLLLIFFLVATTMDIDTGLSRLLPPMPEEEQKDDQEIRERNVFVVLINRQDQLFVEDGFYDIGELKQMTKDFILNQDDDPDLSEKRPVTIDFFGDVMVSKGVISLRNDVGTSYGQYIAVQNELAAAVNELRNGLSMSKFGKRYDDLDPLNEVEKSMIEAIKDYYPMAISEAEPKTTN